MPTCKNCNQEFTIYPEDKEYYQRFGVPEPTWCPTCREMRRWVFRNTKTLYSRQCDLCHKDVISVYPQETSYTVYCPDCWYSDRWDGQKYAQDFDYSQPFFPQFAELQLKVPRISNYNNRNTVNCDYCNAAIDSKNCYLLFSTSQDEDCYYGYKVINSKDCLDTLGVSYCELCYQCVDCLRCFNVAYAQYATDCHDAAWLFNCSNCHDCFMCVNLKSKEYCFLNQPLTAAEYKKKISDWQQGSYQVVQKYLAEFRKLKLNSIYRFSEQHNCTNCFGNNIITSKNCFYCFDIANGNGDRYFSDSVINTADCMDSTIGSIDNELIYECLSIINSYRVHFCTYTWYSNFMYYCDHFLAGGSYCFGCTALKKAKYCILNKQFSEEEYQKQVDKIISHMQKTGEWGQFFPVAMSPFAYNETSAMDHFALTKEEVLAKGWRWKDDLPGIFGKETIKADSLSDNIKKIDNKILKETIACIDCARNYKIIKPELSFYQKQNLPLPRQCPDCRYVNRFKQRNPHKLWPRQCMCEQSEHGHTGRCSNEFQTSYAPDRPEKVYCEECYRKEVY
ncbi:MAG: hypothetical protein WC480_02925 [Patescibacteria group bacterium]